MKLLLHIFLLALLFGCSRSADPRLSRVADIVSEHPDSALRLLDSISPVSLSDPDRRFREFLHLKACDKAYITHTSDSLILSLLDYYRGSSLYPEVLYYGGRVYSDLGDYPTALKYFHQSLDMQQDETQNWKLKAVLLSQLGQLYNTLRLYDTAVEFTNKVISLERSHNDTLGEVRNLQLLGEIAMRAADYNASEFCYRLALKKSDNLPDEIRANSLLDLSEIKYYQGKTDSALILLNASINHITPLIRNTALARAAEYHLSAGNPDSAYFYARQLVESDSPLNKKIAYHLLISPELRHYTNPDSIYILYDNYRDFLDCYVNENDNLLAMNQEAMYNYKLHEREKEKALKKNKRLQFVIVSVLFFLMLSAILFLYSNNRKKREIIQMQFTLDKLRKRQESNNNVLSTHPDNCIRSNNAYSYKDSQALELLRMQLISEFTRIADSETNSAYEPISNSEIYGIINQKISLNQILKETDTDLWNKLEETVISISPDFYSSLQLLTNNHITKLEYHTALLVKAGFSPSQIASLLAKSASTIVSRRKYIGEKIFGKTTDPQTVDRLIRAI